MKKNHLHSNMDRFERSECIKRICKHKSIYIPIWIDLKELLRRHRRLRFWHLHSNMDRFESCAGHLFEFSFNDLHSNMDRFERKLITAVSDDAKSFTFQYG